MEFSIEVAGKSDVGCMRPNNEDHLGWEASRGIFVVCDGMGGAAAGEVASRIGVETVLEYFREGAPPGSSPQSTIKQRSSCGQRLLSAIQKANTAIYQAGMRDPAQHGMGTTIVAVAIEQESFWVAHAGDSRAYLLRGGTIQRLTEDHSFAAEMMRRGLMSREAVEQSGLQNIVTRALGSEAVVQPDVREWAALPNDVLLLSSDGLTKYLSDAGIQEIVEQAPSLEAACEQLIEAAKGRGGDDNITCLLLRLVAK